MLELPTNGFWGNRSGTDHPSLGLIFKGRRASFSRTDNSAPNKKIVLRRKKNYRNLKVRRRQGYGD